MTEEQKSNLDANKDFQVTPADASYLQEANFGKTAFISEINFVKSGEGRCPITISARLKLKDFLGGDAKNSMRDARESDRWKVFFVVEDDPDFEPVINQTSLLQNLPEIKGSLTQGYIAHISTNPKFRKVLVLGADMQNNGFFS
eukprot:UC4_evm1s570